MSVRSWSSLSSLDHCLFCLVLIPVPTFSALLLLEPSPVHSKHILPASASRTASSSTVSWWASLSGRAGTGSVCVTVFPTVHLAARFQNTLIVANRFGNTHIDSNRNLAQTLFPFNCIPPSYYPFLHSHTYVVVSVSRPLAHTFAAYP